MNIYAWILAWMLAANALLAQGWRYDVATNQFIPPATVNAPAPKSPPSPGNRIAPRRGE